MRITGIWGYLARTALTNSNPFIARHLEIGQNDIGCFAFDRNQGLFPVACLDHREPSHLFNESAQHEALDLKVVNDERLQWIRHSQPLTVNSSRVIAGDRRATAAQCALVIALLPNQDNL